MAVPEGMRLVRVGRAVFLMGGGRIEWIPTEADATRRFGPDWATKVSPIAAPTLFQFDGTPHVYIVMDGQRYHVANEDSAKWLAGDDWMRRINVMAPGTRLPGEAVEGDEDAFERLKSELDEWGLGSLAEKLWNQITAGEPHSAIVRWIREQDEYKERFAGLVARTKAGFKPMSEAEYLEYENQAAQLMRMSGLPKGFYDDPSDFASFVAKNVSMVELATRIEKGYAAARQAPKEVRQELQRLYGVDEGSLAAYFLNPDKALPVIQRQFAAAQSAGASVRSGYGALLRQEAERLADLGVDPERALSVFSSLANLREVFEVLPGERGGTGIGREAQFGAGFEGDAEDRAAVESKVGQRLAKFQESGGVTQSERGFVGLGRANT